MRCPPSDGGRVPSQVRPLLRVCQERLVIDMSKTIWHTQFNINLNFIILNTIHTLRDSSWPRLPLPRQKSAYRQFSLCRAESEKNQLLSLHINDWTVSIWTRPNLPVCQEGSYDNHEEEADEEKNVERTGGKNRGDHITACLKYKYK